MSELSGFWTTGGATGDQQVSYTQAHWSTAGKIMSGCAGFEGVTPGFLNELAITYISANHCHVASGGAMVDGKWYINNADGLGVTIDSATAGHYRIDRIVALCDWAAFTVRIAVKKNTVEDTTAPALTLTEDWTVSGTHYAILLYQASVTDAGVVTLTDERNFADTVTNAIGIASVTLAKMAANSIDSDQYVDGSIDLAHMSANSVDSDQYVDGSIDYIHLASGASKLTNRQGGSATVWDTVGTSNYTPTSARIQLGAISVVVSGGSGSTAVTFPVAFSDKPLIFATMGSGNAAANTCIPASRLSTGFTAWVFNANDATYTVFWLAIGPE